MAALGTGTPDDPFIQDPDANLDYQIDWSSWLPAGDTITTSTFTADSGLTVGSTSHTTTAAVVWLSGGTVNGKYKIVNRITTTNGRINDHTIYVRIKEQ